MNQPRTTTELITYNHITRAHTEASRSQFHTFLILRLCTLNSHFRKHSRSFEKGQRPPNAGLPASGSRAGQELIPIQVRLE